MKFQALIDSIHFDPKKGTVKIVLIGASHVSLDELTTIEPKDESIWVTLESEQTTFKVTPQSVGDSITLAGEGAVTLKEEAERLRAGEVDLDELVEDKEA